jgi:hypothetical protein
VCPTWYEAGSGTEVMGRGQGSVVQVAEAVVVSLIPRTPQHHLTGAYDHARMDFSLQEELAGLSNADYEFPNELDIGNMDPAEVNATLNGESSCQSHRCAMY